MHILLLVTSVMNDAYCTWFLHMLHHDYENGINIKNEDLCHNRSQGWLVDTYWLLMKWLQYDNSSCILGQEYDVVVRIMKTWLLICLQLLDDTWRHGHIVLSYWLVLTYVDDACIWCLLMMLHFSILFHDDRIGSHICFFHEHGLGLLLQREKWKLSLMRSRDWVDCRSLWKYIMMLIL